MKYYSLFKIVVIAVITSIVVTSCKSKTKIAEGELQGTISLSGAFALYPLAVTWANEFQKLHPHVKIDISAGGAGKGMTDALAKQVDFGMVSREIYAPEIANGAVAFAVAKDAVVATINTENPDFNSIITKGLTIDAAQKLWLTEEYKTWGEVIGTDSKTALHVYTRSDACGAAETWALWMGKKQEDLNGTAVFGDPGVASAIQKDKMGIGFNNLSYAYDENTRLPNKGIALFPIDCNNNGVIDPEENFYDTKDMLIQAIADNKYPSPPARDLYLVTNGVPTSPLLVEFLKYILTEGQAFNVPTGYISMSSASIDSSLSILGIQRSEEVTIADSTTNQQQ